MEMENKLKTTADKIGITEDVLTKMIETADKVKDNSYSCYSNFRVGSSLLCKNGKIIQGTNVENISYGLSNCAERTAIFSAVANGEKEFSLITVSSDLDSFLTPCGACRQVISEFGIKWVLLINKSKDFDLASMDYLMPKNPEIEHLKKY